MRSAAIVIMVSLLRTCFQNEDPYLSGPLFRSRDPRTALRVPAQCGLEYLLCRCLQPICCTALTCSERLLSLLSPLHFFSFPFPSRRDLFLPKNALPTVISVINGHPLTTRFILDHRFVSRGGKIDSAGTDAGACSRSKDRR